MSPGLRRSPGEGKGYPFQYSGLENFMDCVVHALTKSQTGLSSCFFSLFYGALRTELCWVFQSCPGRVWPLQVGPRTFQPSHPAGYASSECSFFVLFCLVAQSCLTLCDPTDCSLPGSSVYGISQARILEWVAISFSRESS